MIPHDKILLIAKREALFDTGSHTIDTVELLKVDQEIEAIEAIENRVWTESIGYLCSLGIGGEVSAEFLRREGKRKGYLK